MPIADSIALLRAVVLSPDCAKMNLSTVKGYLGELLVKQRLEAELGSGRVEHVGNQCGHDLQYTRSGVTIKIDVKTSTTKDERSWGFRYWSWALLTDTKKKISATHFVCAGLDDALALQALFVVNASDLMHFPRDTGQFRNNKHVLFLPQGEPSARARGLSEPLYLRSCELLRLGRVRRVPSELSLVQACA
jgi:hypothetical protein